MVEFPKDHQLFMKIKKLNGDINRVSIIKNGVRGFVNRSGVIIASESHASFILNKKEEVSVFMKNIFGDEFKLSIMPVVITGN